MTFCDGCETYRGPGEYFDCSYHKNNQDGSCPCSNCIVKVMCGDPCDKYDDWVDEKDPNYR